MSRIDRQRRTRRGATLVLAALLLIGLLGMIAFAMDIGYIVLVRSQLQAAADSAAMAGAAVMGSEQNDAKRTARQYAAYHIAGGTTVELLDDDIELGVWSDDYRIFTPTNEPGNALRVTARRSAEVNGEAPLFFAQVFGRQSFEMSASSVATAKARDIAFVVDLSGSMNDDTEPAWATAAINDAFGPLGFPGAGNSLMQEVFQDFNYGSFPGGLQYVGQPLGIPPNNWAYAELTRDNGKLTQSSIAARYRIQPIDNEAVRKSKAYSWIIDQQILPLMSAARPTPRSDRTYAYWEKYLDYLLEPMSVADAAHGGSGPVDPGGQPQGPPGSPLPPIGSAPARSGSLFAIMASGGSLLETASNASFDGWAAPYWTSYLAYQPPPFGFGQPPVNRGALPPVQDSDRIVGFNNPNQRTFPGASGAAPRGHRNWIGYLTYVQYMMDHGTDLRPDNAQVVPLSHVSAYCPYHTEATAGGTFWFPPREQPMHAVRRSLIAAIQVVKERNQGIADPSVRDWVSIIVYYGLPQGGSVVHQPLTGDYDQAMRACTRLQAVGDKGNTTATSEGLRRAREHLLPPGSGGLGRRNTTKDIVLLTDGVPNDYADAPSDIDEFIDNVDPEQSPEFYDDGQYWSDAALMQAAMIRQLDWRLYAVGMGLGADYDFMDRMARIGGTADALGQSPRVGGNPLEYEQRLTDIFTEIVADPHVRITQ